MLEKRRERCCAAVQKPETGAPVPHESMSNRSATPARSTTAWKTASAVGLRQMLPAAGTWRVRRSVYRRHWPAWGHPAARHRPLHMHVQIQSLRSSQASHQGTRTGRRSCRCPAAHGGGDSDRACCGQQNKCCGAARALGACCDTVRAAALCSRLHAPRTCSLPVARALVTIRLLSTLFGCNGARMRPLCMAAVRTRAQSAVDAVKRLQDVEKHFPKTIERPQ